MQTAKPRTFTAILLLFASRTLYAVLALLCLATLILWPQSHWACNEISLTRHHEYLLASSDGYLHFEHNQAFINYRPTPKPVQLSQTWQFGFTHHPNTWRFAGWLFSPSPPSGIWNQYQRSPSMKNGATSWILTGVAVPHWLPILLLFPFILLSIHSAMQSLTWLKQRKRGLNPTLCQSCGYNLSGNPSAPACPECGRPNHLVHTPQSIPRAPK